MLIGPVLGVPQLVTALASRVPVYSITNTNPAHIDYLPSIYPDLTPFRKFFTSYDLGFRKPEAEIFRTALEAAAVPPEHALFIDDLPANVQGAHRLGIHARTCLRSAAQLRAILEEFDLIEPEN